MLENHELTVPLANLVKKCSEIIPSESALHAENWSQFLIDNFDTEDVKYSMSIAIQSICQSPAAVGVLIQTGQYIKVVEAICALMTGKETGHA